MKLTLLKTKFKVKNSKKANMIGIGIIGLAFLLLLGSVITEPSSPISGGGSSSGGSGNIISSSNFNNEVIFYINSTILGKEVIRTTDFPNMRVGASVEYEEISIDRNVKIKSSPLNYEHYTFKIPRDVIQKIGFQGVLIMPYPRDGILTSDFRVHINEKLFSIEDSISRLPIRILANEFSLTGNNTIRISTPQVNWNQFLTSYSQIFSEISIIAIYEDEKFSTRELDFVTTVDEDSLNFLKLKFSVVCPQGEDGSTPLEAYVNGFKVMSQNPTCATRDIRGTILSAEVPKSILNFDSKNTIEIETLGNYQTSLQIEEVSFNTQNEFSFYINRGMDLEDVFIFGDFDREFLDIQINSHRFSIPRRETTSIRTRLRSGRNELILHDVPIEVRSLTIEQLNKIN
ncbi:MAG: hypothetical protein ACMXYB_03295 [Candidatus Woesearchaeota archaeon]